MDVTAADGEAVIEKLLQHNRALNERIVRCRRQRKRSAVSSVDFTRKIDEAILEANVGLGIAVALLTARRVASLRSVLPQLRGRWRDKVFESEFQHVKTLCKHQALCFARDGRVARLARAKAGVIFAHRFT
jgi:hypothetical protein